jgi:hypothetical protein
MARVVGRWGRVLDPSADWRFAANPVPGTGSAPAERPDLRRASAELIVGDDVPIRATGDAGAVEVEIIGIGSSATASSRCRSPMPRIRGQPLGNQIVGAETVKLPASIPNSSRPSPQPEGRLHVGSDDETGQRLASRSAHPSSLGSISASPSNTQG